MPDNNTLPENTEQQTVFENVDLREGHYAFDSSNATVHKMPRAESILADIITFLSQSTGLLSSFETTEIESTHTPPDIDLEYMRRAVQVRTATPRPLSQDSVSSPSSVGAETAFLPITATPILRSASRFSGLTSPTPVSNVRYDNVEHYSINEPEDENQDDEPELVKLYTSPYNADPDSVSVEEAMRMSTVLSPSKFERNLQINPIADILLILSYMRIQLETNKDYLTSPNSTFIKDERYLNKILQTYKDDDILKKINANKLFRSIRIRLCQYDPTFLPVYLEHLEKKRATNLAKRAAKQKRREEKTAQPAMLNSWQEVRAATPALPTDPISVADAPPPENSKFRCVLM